MRSSPPSSSHDGERFSKNRGAFGPCRRIQPAGRRHVSGHRSPSTPVDAQRGVGRELSLPRGVAALSRDSLGSRWNGQVAVWSRTYRRDRRGGCRVRQFTQVISDRKRRASYLSVAISNAAAAVRDRVSSRAAGCRPTTLRDPELRVLVRGRCRRHSGYSWHRRSRCRRFWDDRRLRRLGSVATAEDGAGFASDRTTGEAHPMTTSFWGL